MYRHRYRKEIRSLTAASRRLSELGYATSSGGNLSQRAGSNILITPSGFSKGEVRARDLILIDTHGQRLAGLRKLRVSSETNSHLRVYRSRPDVRGVIHAHPPILTGFALSGVRIMEKPIHPEMIIEVGCMATIDYVEPTTEILADQLESVFMRCNAVLMGSHGVMICSRQSAWHALEQLQMLESMAWSAWVGMTSGKVREILADEIDKLEVIMKTRGLPMPGANGVLKHLRDLFIY